MRIRLFAVTCLPAIALATAGLLSPRLSAAAAPVTLREADETIPTYKSLPPDPNPMFFFGRQSQGAQGNIYPYPLYDNLTNTKGEQTYHVVYLENEYVKIGVLPEIGGRLFSAVDKTNNYDFVYHQHVIKPALIGLIGAWISGGIEWNIPHHHRASTFLPVQWRAEENADGSKTVWVGELEVRQRMRWAVGYTLRPGSSVLECSVRILNRTPLVNTMLCFANVAVNANENYQIIFPPSTQYVTYHFKRDFATWPIANGPYNGSDFSGGVDVSWYKNHFNSNSMFAWNYQDDFFAGYDHGKEAGTMSVTDHHIVPGKKFWTWGNGPRGRQWDNILTDTDGPYVELMVGAYSDNQPDYSWLQPFETRSFDMNWYPFRDIGGVKSANLDAAVNLEVKDGTAKLGFYATKAFPSAMARLTAGGKVLLEEKIAINPGKPYTKQIAVPAGVDEHDLRASLSAGDRELVAYSPVRLPPMARPAVVTPPPPPADIKTDEELDLAGQRLNQFHDPTLDPDPYWLEALRRDPGDTAAHSALGLFDLRRARYASAEEHYRAALARLTAKYTTPKNAEPFYYLGVALQAQGKTAEAYDAFYKATWSQEWKGPSYFSLAEIASARGDFTAALGFTDRSLDANALDVRAYGLKAAMLRHLGRNDEARAVIALARSKTDPLDVRLMAEQWLVTRRDEDERPLFGTLNTHGATAQETAAEYADAGLWRDGLDVLGEATAAAPDATKVSPIVYYYLGEFAEKLIPTSQTADFRGQAADFRQQAVLASSDYVFPFQSEVIPVLRDAMAANPQDARAPYYLGNLLFDWQPEEAVGLWEKSAALDPKFPITWRNLAQAYSHQPGDEARAKAIAAMEKSVALGDAYPTHFAELDQLYADAGTPVEKRLTLLEAHQPAVVQKDEGLASLITLKTFAGRPDEAIALLEGRTFSIWEGGTRFNTGEAWTDAHLARGLQRYAAKQYREALADFDAALKFPANLRAAAAVAGINPRQGEIAYWTACAQEALGQHELARKGWTEVAAATDAAPAGGRGGGGGGRGGFGNQVSTRGVQRYYQALALRQLGQGDKADPILRELLASGAAALKQADAPETGGGFGGRQGQTPRSRTAAAHYVAGLGYSGLGDKDKARAEFSAALASAPDLLGAKLALTQL
jgi:tetratricopeptide (TPR) repeat protein